jgi:processive 1,2-diacylglycerol beta-glucosyltransferase
VLIITSGFGEGHNAAARNIELAIRKTHPGLRVSVHDIYQEGSGWLHYLAQLAYKFTINRAPKLWSFIYKMLDRMPGVASFGLRLFGGSVRTLRKKLLNMQPDVVVSTFPGYGALIAHALGKRRRPFTFITVVTDSLTINAIWFEGDCDFFLVPNEPTARVIENVGIPHEKIRVTGFPVPMLFATPDEHPRESPPNDGLWKVLFMVNSAPHLALEIARALLDIENIALTVTCGRDQKLQGQMKNLGVELEKPLEVHGWTPEMPAIIRRSHVLIGKAGGAAVQEAMAAHTPMIITQVVPGQEEGNAHLLFEKGAGSFASTPSEIADAVRELFEPPAELYADRVKAAARLGHPTGSKDIAHFIHSICIKI